MVGLGTNIIEGDFWIEDDGNEITIGENTSIYGNTHLACIEGTKITIGNNCLFSSEIVFRTGDSHSILNLKGERINQSKNITIKDHVWIGNGVAVNKGVVIAENTIVGTKSVVTKAFDDQNVSIAGNPARIIKKNVNWDIDRIML